MFLNGPHRPQGWRNEDTINMQNVYRQLQDSVMMFRPEDAETRRGACSNPCPKSPKTVCVYVPADKRRRCICPLPQCGPDCSGPWAKTINFFRACLGAQLKICAQK